MDSKGAPFVALPSLDTTLAGFECAVAVRNDRCVDAIGMSLLGEKQSLRYEYDFVDSWEHEVLVEKRLEADTRLYYPLCIGGDSPACQRIAADHSPIPNNAEHDEILTWVGGHFDAEGFDVNRTKHGRSS